MTRTRQGFRELHDAKLGRYQPLASLDEGGMAKVLLALGRGPGRVKKLVVIKGIRPELVQDAEFVAMFLDEARLAARLNHPNVIDIYEVGNDADDARGPFIVMEYLEGQSLQALIARVGRGAMPLPIHLRVLVDALAGLEHAHELRDFDGTPLGIVHRDVSPENVFVCYDGLVKLLDFGIAKAAGSASRTERGKFKGKLGYVAPEQIEGLPLDRRADVFSVGVMLWEALVGRRLTQGLTQQQVARARIDGTQPRVLEARAEAPAALAALCDRAMSLRPEDRFATAGELASAIERQMIGLGWRVAHRQVAALMTEQFAADRARVRASIEQRIVATSDSSSALRPEPLPGHVIARCTVPPPAPEQDEPTLPHTPKPRDHAGEPERTDTVVDARRPGSRWGWQLASIMVGALLALLALAWMLHRPAQPAPPLAPLEASSAAPSGTTQPAPVLSAPATVRLEIAATPSAAVIELDGAPLGANPFRGEVRRAAGHHQVTAAAPGYVSEQRTVSLEADLVLSLSLERRAAGPAAPAVGKAEAGADNELPRPGKPKRAIDGTDPYGP